MNRTRRLYLPLLLLACAASAGAASPPLPAPAPNGPKVLAVTAHPDDDALFAATNYRITHALGGKVDIAVVTNGEGGYKYSDLAKSIYGLDLTDEKVAREYLPGIRKRELLAGGAVIGVRNVFFLDQVDKEYTLDLEAGMKAWDVDYVKARLLDILRRGHYDFVFVMLPIGTSHAGHRGAALLALEAVSQLPEAERPIVLGAWGYKKSSPDRVSYTEHPGYPLSRVAPDAPKFEFDRSQKFSFNNKLDYQIVVNWLIAEHKSQGTMQNVMNVIDVEQFWYFASNRASGVDAARTLFDRLKNAPPP